MTATADFPAELIAERVLAETFVRQVQSYDQVDSTNRAALEWCRSSHLDPPALVIARRQTAGRGRGANRWWSAVGALTFSLVLRPAAIQLTQREWPRASLTTGLAVCHAMRDLMPQQRVSLKWPNDVYVNDRKVCGILIEVGPSASEMLVLGVGINVNNALHTAPEEIQATATSLVDTSGRAWVLADVLVKVLQTLERELARLAKGDEALAHDWQESCWLRGRPVVVDTGSLQKSGICHGIAPDGALLLNSELGTERLYAGTVTPQKTAGKTGR